MELSPDQQAVLDAALAWLAKPTKQYLTIGGYAGTGKTTLTAYLRKAIFNLQPETVVSFCSYTGKASRNLTEKLKEHGAILTGDTVSTIHSLIYTAIVDKQGQVKGWKKKEFLDANLIIVDEASMVDPFILQDLLSYNVPLIAVGDHGQLPPIGTSYSLMAKPDLTLTQIHRQKEGSAIIDISVLARQNGIIEPKKYSDTVLKISKSNPDAAEIINEALNSYNPETLIICGYNQTRLKLNQEIRARRDKFGNDPVVGDRVVALKNNHVSGVYNGATGTLTKIIDEDDTKTWLLVEIELDGENKKYKGHIYKPQFNQKEVVANLPRNPDGVPGDLFDFGYALTVHKAQGSQADSVILFEERFPKSSDEEWRRWLYTAVTRARLNLLIIGN